MNGRVTLRDVAKRAGVHVTTVSKALRDHPSLPAVTKERLRRLAQQMGYRPDPALTALANYRHHAHPRKDRATFAYVTNWETALGWKERAAHQMFFDGATRKAAQLGYKLDHFWMGEPGLTPRRLSDILISRGITGIILASHRRMAEPRLDFDWPRFSAVKIDYFPREPAMHHVTNDQRAVIKLAVQRTLAAGYRRIGFLIPTWWDENMDRAWSAGYLGEQLTLPEKFRIPLLCYPDPEQRNVVPRPLFERWFTRHRPEAIISFAPFVQPQLLALGLKVPQDVAYVEIFLTDTDGHTAGVRQNCHRVGEVAVEILVGQLYQNAIGLPEFPTATFVEGTWCDGDSLPTRAAKPGLIHGRPRDVR